MLIAAATAGLSVVALSSVAVSGAFAGPSPAVSTTCPVGSVLKQPTGGTSSQAQCVITSTGTPVGAVKHVWLIILENKSYDETFTGLNQNSYLWQTLPQQGALLTNYYGTGHFSMDNYISLVSGQSPSYGVQDDCSTTANMTNNNSGIITNGTVGTDDRHRRHDRQLGNQHHGPQSDGQRKRQLRPAPRARRRRCVAAQQRLRVSDRRPHPVQPVQRGRRLRGRPMRRTWAAPSPSGRRPT